MSESDERRQRLEQLASLLDLDPEPDSREGRELAGLLERMQAEGPGAYHEEASSLRASVDELDAKIRDFERRRGEGKPIPGQEGLGAGVFLFPG
jgi:hypothetical protein